MAETQPSAIAHETATVASTVRPMDSLEIAHAMIRDAAGLVDDAAQAIINGWPDEDGALKSLLARLCRAKATDLHLQERAVRGLWQEVREVTLAAQARARAGGAPPPETQGS